MINRLLLTAALTTIVGCQTIPYQPYARDVKRKPQQGGIIALHTDPRDEDRAKAEAMMKTNCGSLPIKVLEEGEVAVGTTTTGTAKEIKDQGAPGYKVGSLFGIPVNSAGTDPSKSTESATTTTSVKEWQISYECLTGSSGKKSTIK